jgi:hypothetical protein
MIGPVSKYIQTTQLFEFKVPNWASKCIHFELLPIRPPSCDCELKDLLLEEQIWNSKRLAKLIGNLAIWISQQCSLSFGRNEINPPGAFVHWSALVDSTCSLGDRSNVAIVVVGAVVACIVACVVAGIVVSCCIHTAMWQKRHERHVYLWQ